MHIGLLTARIEIAGSESLKDKRQVVRSLITRIRDKINVSAAEVEDLDLWQAATLAFVVVSNDVVHNDQTLEKVAHMIENEPRCHLLGVERENL
jgi:uncharacterized protein YlxP (DUF503 family)